MPNAIIDLTPLANALVGLCALIVTSYFIPWLKSHHDDLELAKLQKWVGVAVSAAQQMFDGTDSGEQKYSYVEQFLASKGYKIDPTQIKALIESAVYALKTSAITPADNNN